VHVLKLSKNKVEVLFLMLSLYQESQSQRASLRRLRTDPVVIARYVPIGTATIGLAARSIATS
jgi:hypothetical protein